jgi:hypothetical protein
VAGDVGAILRGQQLAQATPVIPGTGLATGPPGVGKPAALAAPPFIGNYNDTPATPPASTVTPPAVPAPQTTTMATRPASQTAPVRDLSTIKPTDMTQPEWLKYYRTTPTPQELVDRGVVQPADAPEFRKAQADLAKAEAAAAANRAAAQNAANQTQSGLMPQDQVARLIQASNDADKTVEAARDKYTTLLHDTT